MKDQVKDFFDKLKSFKLIAYLVIIYLIIIGLANFTDSIKKIYSFSKDTVTSIQQQEI